MTPQHPSKWRGRLLFGLAGLVFLPLLALGLLFGYGAWLNAQAPPVTIEPVEPEHNKPAAQYETDAQPSKQDAVSSPSLTLAELQKTADEPDMKALIDDLKAMPRESYRRRFPTEFGPLDEHWVTFLDRHQATIERLKIIARQDLWRVILQPIFMDGFNRETPLERQIFAYMFPTILAMQGRLVLQRGDEAMALEVEQLLFHLAYPPDPSIPGLGTNGEMSWRLLKYWIETGPSGAKARRALSNFLESGKENMRARLNTSESIHLSYRKQQSMNLERYNKPWNSRIYHWDPEESPEYFQCKIVGFLFPRPDHYVHGAVEAMIAKKNTLKYLADCDAYYKDWEKRAAGLEYPALQAIQKPQPPRIPCIIYYESEDHGIYSEGENQEKVLMRDLIGFLTSGTEFNINRAALAWLEDPHSRPAEGTVDFHKTPTHPWRDPFTEQPFHVDQTATATLIYSLGPDLADQHGQLAYDPTNGAASAGDIVIHIGGNHDK